MFVEIEDGFLLATPGGVRRVPSPVGGRLRDAELVAGAEAGTEGCLFQVVLCSGEVPHALFFRTTAPRASDEEVVAALDQVRAAEGEGRLALVMDQGVGWATVAVDESDHPEDTAGAVAAAKWRWGWDGSATMDVSVDATRFEVTRKRATGGVAVEVSLHSSPVEHYDMPAALRQSIRDRSRRGRSLIPGARTDTRELARVSQVLPLKEAEDGLYALRHDGVLVRYTWEETLRARESREPAAPEGGVDPSVRRELLSEATEHYPFLKPLLDEAQDERALDNDRSKGDPDDG